MSNMGFAGVANFAMTSTATAVRVMGVAGVGSTTEIVGGPSLGLNFLPMVDAITVLDPRITFSRTSNATLTGSNGLIQYAPHNLLTYSEQFDNAVWVKSNTTVTANTVVAPDGTTTADKLIANTTSIEHLCRGTLTLSATTHTLSVYAKAGEYSWVALTGVSFANAKASFNLSAGTVGTVSGSGSPVASISNAGNGWFRCVLTFTASASSANYGIAMANGNDSTLFAGDGVSGIYIWGAQLEIGSTATTYNPTTVKNLLGYSQAFDNAAWTKSNATVAATLYDGPFGYLGAEKLVEDTATSEHYVLQSAALTVSTRYTISVYAKAAERTKFAIQTNTTGSYVRAAFDLSTGSVISTGAGLTAAISSIGNGWYRCSVLATANASASKVTVIQPLDASGANSYTGDGTSGIYIFGAQLSDSASLDPYVYNVGAAPSAAAYYGPRFDYDPVTLAPKGLLIEEQRTNLVLNSDTLSTQNVTVSATAYTLSFYGTGTVTLSGVSTAGPLVGSGDYPSRVTLTFTPTAGTLTLTVSGSVRFAQLEAGSFATSYIPTVASQVTRAADVASMQGTNFSQWFRASEGTLYAEASTFGTAAVNYITNYNDSTTSNRMAQYFSTAAYVGLVTTAGAAQATLTIAGTSPVKHALAYATNDFIAAANGSLSAADTSGTVPVLSQLNIGSGSSTASPINGWIKRIAYYNRRLANSELQALTA